jgi:hypothetical protein
MAQQPAAQKQPIQTIRMFKGAFPHIWWLDLDGNGSLTECAVMKVFPSGDVNFIPVAQLDNIDKERLIKIINNRNADMYELWDLMSQITLGNGKNALEYFSQLVRARTASGVEIPVGTGRMGVPLHLLQPQVPPVGAPGAGPAPTK